MSDDKLKNDPYSNPDMLKKGDVIYPENVEPETKRSGRIPRLFLLIALPISFLLGLTIFGRLGHENNVNVNDVVEVVVTVEVIDSVDAVNDGELSWQLSNQQVTTAEGTFTEWIAGSPENDEIPWFRDIAYHAGTNAVYLAATHEDGLYVVSNNDGNYTEIAWLDLSLRVDGSIYQIFPYDNDHLLLLGDQFALYNVVTDRVVSSWPVRYQSDTPELYFSIGYGGVVVGEDGRIYVLQTVADGESYKDEIQIFSSSGDYLSTLTAPVDNTELVLMTPDNAILLYDDRELFEYDQQTEAWRERELLPAFVYAEAAEFHPNGSLYTVGGSEAWLAEMLPNGEVGIAYPSSENARDRTGWPLGQTGDPTAVTILPDGSFVVIDSRINGFQRIFRLELPTLQ